MPTAEEMRSVTQDIVDTYEDRTKRIAQLQEDVRASRQDVHTMLKAFDQQLKEVQTARVTASKELRADLAQGATGLRQDVDTMLKGFDTALGEFRSILAGGRDEWQKLAATMQARRQAAVIEANPMAAAASPAETTAPEVEAAETTQELAAVGDRVFEYLANHPDGTRLVELEQEFDLARIQMSRVIRSLIEENKVEKRGLLYFAI